jgi:hydrogenase maturation protease
VIGIGNSFRRDDGLGPAIARRIAESDLPGARVIESSGDLTSLADEMRDCDSLVLIDSVSAGGAPGSIYRIDPLISEIPTANKFSTHGIGITQALALLKKVSGLPAKTILYGIEGADFSHGEGLSDPVLAAIDALVDHIKNDLRE